SDILAVGPARAAGRAAINAGGAHSVEKSAVRRRVAGGERAPSRFLARKARPRGLDAVGHGFDHSMLLHIGAKCRCAILGHPPRPNTPGLSLEFGKLPGVTRGPGRARFPLSAPFARLEEMMGKLRHLAIVVKDLEASCRFYEKS